MRGEFCRRGPYALAMWRAGDGLPGDHAPPVARCVTLESAYEAGNGLATGNDA